MSLGAQQPLGVTPLNEMGVFYSERRYIFIRLFDRNDTVDTVFSNLGQETFKINLRNHEMNKRKAEKHV